MVAQADLELSTGGAAWTMFYDQWSSNLGINNPFHSCLHQWDIAVHLPSNYIVKLPLLFLHWTCYLN